MRAAMILSSIMLLGACNMSADAQTGDNDGGGGRTGQRSFEVGTFDKISLAGSHDVIVTVGGAPSVRAEGDAEALERLEIRVEDGQLRIGSKRGSWSVGRGRGVTVHVTAPSLAAAAIGGSGDMRIDKVEGSGFDAEIGGSGDMQIAALKVGKASFSIAGSGGITAAGTAGTATISIAGSGDVNTAGLESRTATVSVVGSGDVSARAMETAKVSIMGSGDVAMSGSAKCTISKMGSGDVRCET